jgi:hypothetical protein
MIQTPTQLLPKTIRRQQSVLFAVNKLLKIDTFYQKWIL